MAWYDLYNDEPVLERHESEQWIAHIDGDKEPCALDDCTTSARHWRVKLRYGGFEILPIERITPRYRPATINELIDGLTSSSYHDIPAWCDAIKAAHDRGEVAA